MEKGFKQALGGRKATYCAGAALLITVVFGLMVWKVGKVLPGDFQTYVDFIKWDLGIFVFGNVGEHFSKKKEITNVQNS